MKKIKVLSFALVLALMLMGAGYAAWSDNLIINTTVETGELNINFVKDVEHTKAKGAEYVSPTIEIVDDNAHVAKVALGNLYPGSWAAFRIKGINCGTIPAKIDNVQVSFSGDEDLLPFLTYEAGLTVDVDGDNIMDNEISKFSGKLQNIAEDFNERLTSLRDVKLEPYNKGNFYFNIPEADALDLDEDGYKERYIIIRFAENTPDTLENKTLTFTLITNFIQHN